MSTFKYTAVATDGTKVHAAVEAPSEHALRNELNLRNLRVLKVKEKSSFKEIELTKQRVPSQLVMHFSRQLAAFVRGGIPITQALLVVEEGMENKRFREILHDMNEALHSGVTFSEALAAHASILPPYYLGIVRSAEHTGKLDIVLDQLADYMERDIESKQRLRSAIAYPAVIAVAAVAVVVLMVQYVLPKLTQFFKQFGVEQPPLTARILISISDFFKHNWWFMPLVIVLSITVYLLSKKTERGGLIRDRILLRLWLIGPIVRLACVERFCKIVATMMRAGVPLPDTMHAAIQSVNNKVFERKLEGVTTAVLAGEGMADPIGATNIFPKAAVQMMKVGEETGTLDKQLDIAAEYYGSELEYKLKRLMSYFEPAIIIVMGGVVGYVAITMVQSIYGMIQGGNFGA